MNETITPETFVAWLRDKLEDPREPLPSILDIGEQLIKVETAESIYVQALREHEKLRAFVAAGFSRQEAFTLITRERVAMIHAAVNYYNGNNEQE